MLNDKLEMNSQGKESVEYEIPVWKTRQVSKNSIVYNKIQNKARLS